MRSIALVFTAFVAGALSITSPCALPLLPGYLSYISAVPQDGHLGANTRSVVLRASLRFVAGFTTVFVALGATASSLGVLLIRNLPRLTQASGAVVVLLGLASLGILRIPCLARERRFDLTRVARGPRGAFPLGMAFAFGWTPCIGPVLATILTLAASTRSLSAGAILLGIYALGLGVPFIMLGLGFQRLRTAFAWLQRHGTAVERLGAIFLVLIGIALLTGAWQELFLPAQRWFARFGWPPI